MAEHKYNTRQRDEILHCLNKNSGGHMTVDDICDMLKKDGKNVGRTTVYRHLDSLCDSGELLKFSAGDKNPSCYQLCSQKCSCHYHMVCECCGKLFHMQCSEINEFIEHFQQHHNFTVDMTRTTFYGICDECKSKKGNNIND